MKKNKFTPLNPAKQEPRSGYLTGRKGFTLIEILVVIGIIAVLAAIVIIAINPARQFAQARNSQRTSNVNAILNAIGQKMADCKGKFDASATECPTTPACPSLPSFVGTTPNTINSLNAPAAALKIAIGGGNIDLSCLSPSYIPALPYDPSATGAHWTDSINYDTGYSVITDSSGRVTIYAPTVESNLNQTDYISVTR